MDLQLSDQTAFVAGSSRGIGRAIATALLAEGANVVLTGRNRDSLEQTRSDLITPENHTRILAIPGDFTEAKVVEAGFDQTVRHFGRLDHLIANYGRGSGALGPTPPAEDWIGLFEQNFFASVRLTE